MHRNDCFLQHWNDVLQDKGCKWMYLLLKKFPTGMAGKVQLVLSMQQSPVGRWSIVIILPMVRQSRLHNLYMSYPQKLTEIFLPNIVNIQNCP